MSAETDTAVGESQCWCCGQVKADETLLHLESHPEVNVCVDCGVFLGRRARDYRASAARKRLRASADSIRGEVMSRGLHERPVIGRVLMWINRHTPW